MEEEAAITAELARELAVAAPVGTVDGGFVGVWMGSARGGGGVRTLLYREIPREVVGGPSAAQAARLGELIARVHVAGARLPRRSRCVDAGMLGERAIEHAAPYLRACGVDETEVRVIASDMRRVVESVALPGGFVHGDLHLENVRFEGERPSLIDFACAGDGPFAYDLACYWRKRLLAQDGDAAPAEWSAFLAGYGAVRALSAEELAVIPALACLRAVWVMGLPALPSEAWGAAWLTDPAYFAGHMEMIRRFARVAAEVSARAGMV
jgi:Ser/Thr protein kinase RdoA (MazF antagonist)